MRVSQSLYVAALCSSVLAAPQAPTLTTIYPTPIASSSEPIPKAAPPPLSPTGSPFFSPNPTPPSSVPAWSPASPVVASPNPPPFPSANAPTPVAIPPAPPAPLIPSPQPSTSTSYPALAQPSSYIPMPIASPPSSFPSPFYPSLAQPKSYPPIPIASPPPFDLPYGPFTGSPQSSSAPLPFPKAVPPTPKGILPSPKFTPSPSPRFSPSSRPTSTPSSRSTSSSTPSRTRPSPTPRPAPTPAGPSTQCGSGKPACASGQYCYDANQDKVVSATDANAIGTCFGAACNAANRCPTGQVCGEGRCLNENLDCGLFGDECPEEPGWRCVGSLGGFAKGHCGYGYRPKFVAF